ncbi:MAG: 4Fe-4S dicluster domain-containing protein [Planctomycetota bacterium]|jgi:ferredoxin
MGTGEKPYTIDEKVIRRFDPRRTVFARIGNDPSAPFYRQSVYARSAEKIAENEPGRSRPDYEEVLASWTAHDYFRGAFSAEKLGEPDSVMAEPEHGRHEFASPAEAAERIKAAALRLGACLAGVARVNPLWIHSHRKGRGFDLPAGVENALVMCVPMDRDDICKSPGFAASAATGRAYSMMAVVASGVAELIRRLGYRAISCGNGTALSIPLAIDAGLGVMGRSGMLLTEEFGPFVRICKVFTDLPLAADDPRAERPDDFCRKCKACARKCPVGAISDADGPGYDTPSPSNNPGVLRWPVDADKCYCFWVENGSDCSTCLAACPYGQ